MGSQLGAEGGSPNRPADVAATLEEHLTLAYSEYPASDLLTLVSLLQAVNEPWGTRTPDALIKRYRPLAPPSAPG